MKIKQFKRFFQVLNDNGHVVEQYIHREDAENYVVSCGRCPVAHSDMGLQSVYRYNTYRDHRYFLKN